MTVELPPVAILAGGLGTRLHPITQTIPKALVDINGTPFIDHQLRLLYSKGINRVVMCVGHLGEMIQDHAGDGERYGLRIDYVFDGDRLLGTAGAIKNALPLLGDIFYILYGDSYLTCDYADIYRQFIDSHKPALMTVYHNENKWDTSNVIYQDGLVVLYDKRTPSPKMLYIDYGLTIVHADTFDGISANETTDLSGIYNHLSKEGQLVGYEVRERFYEVGTLVGIRQLEAFLGGIESK